MRSLQRGPCSSNRTSYLTTPMRSSDVSRSHCNKKDVLASQFVRLKWAFVVISWMDRSLIKMENYGQKAASIH